MHYKGFRSCALYSSGNRSIPYFRAYYHCASCGKGLHPQDELEGVNTIRITPRLQEVMSLFGMREPYHQSPEDGASVIERVLHVKDLSRQMQRVVMAHGSRLRELREDELRLAREMDREETPPVERAGCLVVQMDGGMVRSDGRWREVKNGVVYWKSDRVDLGKRGLILRKEYVSTLSGGIDRFRDQLDGAILKMGGSKAAEMEFVADGAEWIWKFKQDYYPDAREILDWTHAKDYLVKVAEAFWPPAHWRRKKWMKRQKAFLWEGEISKVLVSLKRLNPKDERQKKAVKDTLRFYGNNRHRMDYAVFRDRDYTIGSGAVESSHKYLVQARMKQAGMRWKEDGAEAIINLRVFWYNDQWDDAFQNRYATAA